MALYRASDYQRFLELPSQRKLQTGRSDFRRDYARVVHSAALRRLQGKTQLFAGAESDFFRNRLSHSLEVAQVAKTIASILNSTEQLRELGWFIDTDLVECASLAHDLGHPPFGHTGEAALDRLMAENGGFEGNAQTFRLLTRLEKKLDDPERQLAADKPRWFDARGEASFGLNLCMRTLASVIKYDHCIPWRRTPSDKLEKGYYASESGQVEKIKEAVLGNAKGSPQFRTVECQIMDLADDIAYSTYDIEDAFRAGLVTPLDLLYASDAVLGEVGRRCRGDLASELGPAEVTHYLKELLGDFGEGSKLPASGRYQRSKITAEVGFFRGALTSAWVDAAVAAVTIDPDRQNPALSIVAMDIEARARVSVLKHLVYVLLIESPSMRLVARRGTHIVKTIFKELQARPDLLPDDWAERYDQAPSRYRPRVVCDFIAGMTDRQAIDFFARLRSSDFRSMFGLA